ncbi:DUF1464 family protein [Tengunoibacter tsumagoiensis]|uniref:Pilus assembly protein PilM n=1 Tax=Tengunoibacter tsumagoiensis TaxID=2014871 RepID=A0A402A222_9CHLR|nr:DUF1464 family protein [Tengunoibacter tsumagoiensis]GCE13174.1 hypothetical protein KTT_30330 [Tengunoibacter tsumagoiensis]
MALSIGIEIGDLSYRICLTEKSQIVEYQQFADLQAVQAYVEQTCALYPEPVIALASPWPTTLSEIYEMDKIGLREGEQTFLSAIEKASSRCYHIPDVASVPTIPPYRRLLQQHMGGSDLVCMVANLLYRMRQQDAAWPEMRFFFLELERTTTRYAYRLAVIVDGLLIDAQEQVFSLSAASEYAQEQAQNICEQAFWESLTRQLAGFQAIHHLEDVVVYDRSVHSGEMKNAVIERLDEHYQFYHFPLAETEPAAFQVARGASLLAEGLSQSSLAAEVVQHLLLSLPQAKELNYQSHS